MNEIQKELLKMFSWLIRFLDEHNISYYAVGGTLLGAIRHKGFIPWDDDIDIAIPRNDYEKLKELFKGQIDNYILEFPDNGDKEYIYSYAKLYNLNTTLIENNKKMLKRGIFIDIFPLDGLDDSLKISLKKYRKIDFLNIILAMKNCKFRKERKWWKNLAIIIGNILIVNKKKLAKLIDVKCSKYNYNDCKYVGNLMSTYRKKEIIAKEIYGVPKEYFFENIKIKGPEHFAKYLEIIYGDWEKLPPIEKQCSVHDYICIDLNVGWRDN